ncbi:MAG: hypothetical protein RIB46_00670 [Pseudomonadales bacterium]
MKATTKDLRLHTQEILAAADRGETVLITYRGRCRAVLRGWPEQGDRSATAGRNPAFGLWADRSEDVAAGVRRLREPRRFD